MFVKSGTNTRRCGLCGLLSAAVLIPLGCGLLAAALFIPLGG